MTTDTTGGKQAGGDKQAGDERRHPYGPRAVGAVLPALTKAAFRHRSPAAARLLTDWPEIIGPTLAAVTTPRRLAAGTLSIGCCGPVALELQHLSDQVAARINTYFGSNAVTRIRLIQEARNQPLARPPTPRPRAVASAASAVAELPPGTLRDALQRLGEHILSRV